MKAVAHRRSTASRHRGYRGIARPVGVVVLGLGVAILLCSIVGFVLLVKGYALARLDPVVLYSSPTWLRHGAQLLLIPVFPIFLSAYLPGRIRSAVSLNRQAPTPHH